MNKIRYAFTMIELIFVIVIIGILSKFGVEFLAQAYNSFIFSSINNTLQAQSATAVETIGARLQFRIKDSIIAKDSTANAFVGLGGASGNAYNVLEWVGTDIDGNRGNLAATWSGIIDLQPSTKDSLSSPGTDTSVSKTLIEALSTSTFDNAAIYFKGSNSNVLTDYGWDHATGAFTDQNKTMHPIKLNAGDVTLLEPRVGDFGDQDVYEYYQLAWTAYAVSLNAGNLLLHYDYQPWDGDNYLFQSDGVTPTKSVLIMENVDTFRFKSVGSVVKIQVCVKTTTVDTYSLCKEKTIY